MQRTTGIEKSPGATLRGFYSRPEIRVFKILRVGIAGFKQLLEPPLIPAVVGRHPVQALQEGEDHAEKIPEGGGRSGEPDHQHRDHSHTQKADDRMPYDPPQGQGQVKIRDLLLPAPGQGDRGAERHQRLDAENAHDEESDCGGEQETEGDREYVHARFLLPCPINFSYYTGKPPV